MKKNEELFSKRLKMNGIRRIGAVCTVRTLKTAILAEKFSKLTGV